MKKPPRKMGIPRCTCVADPDGNIVQADDINCNYHVKSSQESIDWIESNLWNPND